MAVWKSGNSSHFIERSDSGDSQEPVFRDGFNRNQHPNGHGRNDDDLIKKNSEGFSVGNIYLPELVNFFLQFANLNMDHIEILDLPEGNHY